MCDYDYREKAQKLAESIDTKGRDIKNARLSMVDIQPNGTMTTYIKVNGLTFFVTIDRSEVEDALAQQEELDG